MERCKEMEESLLFTKPDALNEGCAVGAVKCRQRAGRVWIGASGDERLNSWKRDWFILLSQGLVKRRESKALWHLVGGRIELGYAIYFRLAVQTLGSDETVGLLSYGLFMKLTNIW